ncbi:MAG: RNA methyltransferase [Promethearchaeota archaeon]
MNKKNIQEELNKFQETHIAPKFRNLKFTIVLAQPEHASNIGSIARIMKNFDFNNLVIFNPIEKKENILCRKTEGYAMHGKDVLYNSTIINNISQINHVQELSEYLKKFDLIFGTTAKGSNYQNIKRLPIFTHELNLPVSKKPLNIAILFGKESRGLTNEEIKLADIVIRIPTGNTYPTLNISQACGIICYEIFKQTHNINIGRGVKPILLADKINRRVLYEMISSITSYLKIRSHKKDNVILSFKNVLERSLISKKELSLIMGIFSKIDSILSNSDLLDD